MKDRYGTREICDREHRIIVLVSEGLKNKEIAKELGTTEYVVKNYLRVIYDKLGLWNRVELALWYVSRTMKEKVNDERQIAAKPESSTAVGVESHGAEQSPAGSAVDVGAEPGEPASLAAAHHQPGNGESGVEDGARHNGGLA